MFARTARLMLRPGWSEDAIPLARAIGHEAVVSKLTRAPWPYALGDAQTFLNLPADPAAPSFLVFEDPTGTPRLVGGIALDATGTPGVRELGYWFTPDAWGRGYATEAGRAVVGIARHGLGLKRLTSGHFVDNPASGRVLQKLGFRTSGGIEQRHSLARGADVPCALYERDLAADCCDDPFPVAPLPLAA